MTVELTSSPALPLTTRRTVQRALSLLEKHLREPGALFIWTWFEASNDGFVVACKLYG